MEKVSYIYRMDNIIKVCLKMILYMDSDNLRGKMVALLKDYGIKDNLKK